MAKTSKIDKKVTKKDDPSKVKTPVASSKAILAKAAALVKPMRKNSQTNGKKRVGEASSDESSDSSDDSPPPAKSSPTAAKKTAVNDNDNDDSSDSSDSSSSEESSSEESDTGDKGKGPAKTARVTEQKTVKKLSRNSDSEEPSGEDSNSDDDDEEIPSLPQKTAAMKAKESSDSANDSDDSSSSEESSSGSDSDEMEVDKTPARPAPTEENKKRKADSEAVVPPKKTKLTDDNATAETPDEETKSIFVGRLSWNVDNDWLAQEFAECGEVASAHVQTDRNTGRSRGFGYVHFTTAEAVTKALALNGKEIDGRAVNIDRSTSPDKKASMEKRAKAFGDTASPPSAVLFVGNLSFSVNEDTLWETFGEHGDIKSVRIPTDRDSGRPKGFAYVEFSEVGAAKKAHGVLQGYELDGRSIRLDFSQPRDSTGGGRGGQGGRGGRGRGFGGDRGRGGGRGGRGGDRGGRGRGRGARGGGIAQFEGRKITFD